MRNIKKGLPPVEKVNPFFNIILFVSSLSIVENFIRKIKFYSRLSKSRKRTQLSIELINSSNDSKPDSFGSNFGYEDDLEEFSVVIKYSKSLQNNFENGAGESESLYQNINKPVSKVFNNNQIAYFFNFGVSYGYIDSLLAAKYKNVEFIGSDRSVLTKMFNEHRFQSLKNLTFISGDIFNNLKKDQYDKGVFFHTRTLVLLPKFFIKELYARVKKAGFRTIICFEQIGISRQTLKSYSFSDEDQPSVAYREGMYIHNYPFLLKDAGFSVQESKLLEVNHTHDDYRILSIIASAND